MSAIKSTRRRSPKLMPLATRRSNWKNIGIVKLLRPRSPTQPVSVVLAGGVYGTPALVRHLVGLMNATLEMYGETVAPAVPAATTEGRISEAPRSRRESSLVITLNGLPEETSISGAIVMSLIALFMKESPDLCGEV